MLISARIFLIIIICFKVSLDTIKEPEVVQINFPVTIGTVPFRIPNSNKTPKIKYGKFQTVKNI